MLTAPSGTRVAGIVACLIVVAVLGAAAAVIGDGSAGAADHGKGEEDKTLAAELLQGSEGWALTTRGLEWTDDAGANWRSIQPRGLRASADKSVKFADPEHGVLVAGEENKKGEIPAVVYSTDNGGESWSSERLREPLVGVGQASLSFSEDGKTWFVQVNAPSTGLPVGGVLYSSGDGGGSWHRIGSPPEAGYISFTSAQEGWMAGYSGTRGEGLFRTRDGGRSWQVVTVRTPRGVGELGTSYGNPYIAADGTGVLPVTFNGDFGHTAVGVYVTTDSGVKWALARLVHLKGSIGPGGEPGDTVFVGPRRLIVMDPGYTGFTEVILQEDVFPAAKGVERRLARGKVIRSLAADTSVQAVSTKNLPPGINPIDFAANEEEAFAVEDSMRCEGADHCPVPDELLVSYDGGVTWTPVTPS